MQMKELERKVVNDSESHNIGSPLYQVAQLAQTSATSSQSDVFQHEEQDLHMASKMEERLTNDETRTSNTNQLNSNSPENDHEVEALSHNLNTNNQGPTVSTKEDVNMDEQTNMSRQLHELDQAPLAFAGEDINMGGWTNMNSQLHMLDQAPLTLTGDLDSEGVDMGRQAMDTGRSEDVRSGKQRRQPLDEDEEDFGLYKDNLEGNSEDDSDPEIVILVHVWETWIIWLRLTVHRVRVTDLQSINPYCIFKGLVEVLALGCR